MRARQTEARESFLSAASFSAALAIRISYTAG